MTAQLTIVVNPAAGGGRPARYLPAVTAVLDAASASYTVRESTSLADAAALATAAAARGDTVVSFGGDGLTGALAGALARGRDLRDDAEQHGAAALAAASEPPAAGERPATDTQPATHARPTTGTPPATQAQPATGGQLATFGVIPAGRGNDFARTLGIPFDPAAAARVLLDGAPRPVDLIAVTGASADGPELVVAGSVYVGIASVAGEIANRARLVRGPLVYNLAALRALLGWKPTTFKVTMTGRDGQSSTDEFAGYVVVAANLPYFGAGMKVAPEARCDDGLLEIVIMRHAPKPTFVRALMKIKDGSHVTLAQVSTGHCAVAEVSADRPLPVGADGESLPARMPLRVRALPAALNVIAPRAAPAGTTAASR